MTYSQEGTVSEVIQPKVDDRVRGNHGAREYGIVIRVDRSLFYTRVIVKWLDGSQTPWMNFHKNFRVENIPTTT